MPYDVLQRPDVFIPFYREVGIYTVPRIGTGYLAGEFPDGITTVEGAPVSAEVRVLLRTASGALGDGAVVAVTQSAADGTWRVDGLPLGFKYDVVGRKAGRNDMLMADVSPAV